MELSCPVLKKPFLLIFLLSVNFSLVFADFENHEITKYAQLNFALPTVGGGIESEKIMASSEFCLETHWFDGIIGIKFCKNAFDFTIAGDGWLPFANWYFSRGRISIGLGSLYHFQTYRDISSEHDFIIDTAFRYHSYEGFTITFHGGYSIKASHLNELQNSVSFLIDHYPSLSIRIEKLFKNGIEIYCEHGTHDLYRFPIFCTPNYILGGAFNFNTGLRLGGEIEFRITDQYTTAPYLEQLIFQLTARYTF